MIRHFYRKVWRTLAMLLICCCKNCQYQLFDTNRNFFWWPPVSFLHTMQLVKILIEGAFFIFMQSFTYTIEMFVLFSELLGLTWRRKNMDELSWLLQWLASMETLAKQIIGDEWRLILIFTQNFASNKTNASCIHCIQISLIADFRLDIVKK